MFHLYVRASSGRLIDFDRAAWLMDGQLFRHARDLAELPDEYEPTYVLGSAPAPAKSGGGREVQALWETYARLHLEKYGCGFTPDVSPNWDA